MDRIGPPSLQCRGLVAALRRGALAIGFWGAIALPLVTLPVLVVLPSAADVVAVVIVANLLCLVVGQRHDPGRGWLARPDEDLTVTEATR